MPTTFLVIHLQSHLSDGELRCLKDLLYNGFYAYEALTPRDLNSVICGICGIAGEIYLGDGNDKNYCNNKHVSKSTVNYDNYSLSQSI